MALPVLIVISEVHFQIPLVEEATAESKRDRMSMKMKEDVGK